MKIALSFIGCHGRGGVERLLLETANFLAGRGHGVHVFATDFDSDALHPCIERHIVPAVRRPALLRLMSYTRRCRAEIKRLESDVHGAFGVISPPGGIVNVQSVHRAWIEASKGLRNLRGRLRQAVNPLHPFLLTLEQRYFGERNYRKLIAPTEQVKADLVRCYAVPPEDIAIVPNGFAPGQLNAARAKNIRPEMRRKLGYREGDFVVLFVANELERKGFTPLLRAIARLKTPRVHLLAVVGRVSVDAYRAEIRRLGLEGHFQFVGAQSDLAPYYAAADVLALPTQYEAWGLVIVEALACGTPILTSRLAGASVAVREGVTGELLEDPCNVSEIAAKLDHLARNHSIPRQDVAASVQIYQWSSVLVHYERLLESA